jgi:hypothetical protein
VFVSSPEKFADWYNVKIPDAYRKITADDVRLMTECKLIGRYRYYGRPDLETVRGVLQYEQLRENRPVQQDKEKNPPRCKICAQPLPPSPESRAGRPKEYCPGCEPHRSRWRQAKLRHRRRE